MKKMYSFFSVLTIVAMVIMPFTHTTAIYAQEVPAVETIEVQECTDAEELIDGECIEKEEGDIVEADEEAVEALSVEAVNSDTAKINVCHATESDVNPWNAQNVNDNSKHIPEHVDDFLYEGPAKDNGKPDNSDGQADQWCVDNAPQTNPDPVYEGSIEVCKIIVDATGEAPVIVDGTGLEAAFSINIDGPDGFSETVGFDTTLFIDTDIVDDNGKDLDAECQTLDFTKAGEFTYEMESIDEDGGHLWAAPTYHDYYNETPSSLSDFVEYTQDGNESDDDNTDGVMNLNKNNTRKLVIVNTLEERAQDTEVTIVAHKIVCEDETDLPNWGNGSTGPSMIDENTAQTFVDEHKGCDFAREWDFQWAPLATIIDYTADSNAGDLGENWTTFGSTDENGMTSVSIDMGEETSLWIHEVWNENYIPFTGQNTNQDISAEIYCHTDVLNYDNFERVDGIEVGETYYCVAFNVPVEEPLTCNPGENLIANGSFENPVVDNNKKWAVYDEGFSGLEWLVSWITNPPQPGIPATVELQRGVNGWTSYEGEQHTELGSDWDGPFGPNQNESPAAVKIAQMIETIPGEKYTLSFAFSPRPETDEAQNVLGIFWDGAQEDSLSQAGSSNVDWSSHEYVFTATESQTEIAFADLGTNDTFGPFLDDVSLVCGEGDDNGDGKQPTGIITYPVADNDEEGPGIITLMAEYDDHDDDNDDIVQWAVRFGTCSGGVDTVAGNVDGFSDAYNWDGADFSSDLDTDTLIEGDYCFVFNPKDDVGENDVRETRWFTIDREDGGNGDGNLSPSVELIADPDAIELNATTTLFWSGSDGDAPVSCEIDNGVGVFGSANGSVEVSPESTTTYTITCTDDDEETVSDSVTVTVTEGNDSDTDPGDENNGGGTGGSSTGGFVGGGVLGASTDGLVLGASCSLYLNDFLHIDSPNNNRMEMVKLQAFLKQYIDPNLEVTGSFDGTTFDAVWAFQLAYAGQVIGPWTNAGLLAQDEATGYVYKTTKRQINMIMCPALAIPVPEGLAADTDVTDNI